MNKTKLARKSMAAKKIIYQVFSNGQNITTNHRLIYRTTLEIMEYFKNPFNVTDDKNCYYWWYEKFIRKAV